VSWGGDRAKPILRALGKAALVVCSFEITSCAAHLVLTRHMFSWSAMHDAQVVAARENAAASSGTEDVEAKRVMSGVGVCAHPYLGYAFDPSLTAAIPHGFSADPNGFHTASPTVQERAPNKLVVAVAGGSVAYWMSLRGADALVEELHKSPALKDKEIALVTVAGGAYKQPQLALALTYLLSLGAQYDVVIELDGFNEIALAPENETAGTFPFYPAHWSRIAGGMTDLSLLPMVGRLALERDQRRNEAAFMASSWLGVSITANVLWSFHDRVREQRVGRLQSELLQAQEKATSYSFLRNGPARRYENEDALYAESAGVWRDASVQMNALAQANGFAYFHFLQPNQYDPGGKPLSAEERSLAYNAAAPQKHHVERGYGVLRRAGVELSARGLQFHDLSGAFAGETRTLYADDCCHPNTEGYRILASAIGRVVREKLAVH
jgi:hypothetical protein